MLTLILALAISADQPTVIAAPTQPLLFIGNGGGYPNPAGTFEVAFTLVDKQDRHSARSPSTTFTAERGWRVVVNPVGLTKESRAVAVCWWWNDAGAWRIFGGPVHCQNPAQVTRPYYPLAGWQYNWAQGHVIDNTVFSVEWNYNKYWWPAWNDAKWKKGSDLAAPPLAPSIRVYRTIAPTESFYVAYSWACNEGETALSPATQVPNGPGRQIVNLARNLIPPNGACGMYVYILDGRTYRRQPAPHVVTPTKPDDYLWRLDSNIISLQQLYRSNIQPSGGPGKSYLSDIHKQIDAGVGHVNLTGNQVIYCPVIMPQQNAFGGSMFRTVGLPNGGQWRLTTAIKPGSPASWPIWVETSQNTRLVGCWMESATAVAGIAFCDCGSGAYHFRSERLRIGLTAPNAVGVIATNESRFTKLDPNGKPTLEHSGSEPILYDTTIDCKYPIIVEWSQSANWNFEYLTAVSNDDFDSAIVTQSNSGFINFRGRMTCDSARTLFAVTAANRVDAENVFCDQGMPEWIVLAYRASPVVDIMVKGMAIRTGTPETRWVHLVTQTSPNENIATVRVRGTNSEACSDSITFTTRYNGIVATCDPSPALRYLLPVQPSLLDWQQQTRYGSWPLYPLAPVVIP